MKVAAAPISWGVIEIPDWGYQMAPDRVLEEMKAVGFDATELGPPGYLPGDPIACRELLDRHGLRLVAGFLATVLHEPRPETLDEVNKQAALLAAAGAEMLVLAASLPGDSYEGRDRLSPDGWHRLSKSLAAAESIAASHGLGLSFHPHVGTAVESREDVQRLLDTTAVNLCLDTGHLFLGGTDPVLLAEQAGARVTHVHLKDVDLKVAGKFLSRELTYASAVREGLYQPLGRGGIDIQAVFGRLAEAGYQGWFVLEQDTALTAEPEPAGGPAEVARQSLDYFRRLYGARQHVIDIGGGIKR
jgi:inosose dehydratase